MHKQNNLTIAEILKTGFGLFLQKYGKQSPDVYKVVNAITSCRTAKLGGHIYRCDHCDHEQLVYNSCRNRHCPTCQARNRAEWVEARTKELLPVQYFHVVFTVPHELNCFAIRNKKTFYNILFKSASETILELSRNKKWINAETGFTTVLHTWGQLMTEHPHLHCIVPGGGLVNGGKKWRHCRKDFLFPVQVMKKIFRGKFMDMFKKAVAKEEIKFHGTLVSFKRQSWTFKKLINTLYSKKWNIHTKEPFAGPQAVLKYLGNYTHRIAISDRRLVKLENNRVTFSYKKRSENNKKALCTIDIVEFIKRFLIHVLPHGFTRIRYYGIFSCRSKKKNLEICRDLLLNGIPVDIDITVPDGVFCCTVCGKGRLILDREIRHLFESPPHLNAA